MRKETVDLQVMVLLQGVPWGERGSKQDERERERVKMCECDGGREVGN